MISIIGQSIDVITLGLEFTFITHTHTHKLEHLQTGNDDIFGIKWFQGFK